VAAAVVGKRGGPAVVTAGGPGALALTNSGHRSFGAAAGPALLLCGRRCCCVSTRPDSALCGRVDTQQQRVPHSSSPGPAAASQGLATVGSNEGGQRRTWSSSSSIRRRLQQQ